MSLSNLFVLLVATFALVITGLVALKLVSGVIFYSSV